MTVLAHLGDIHLDGSGRNAERAERVARCLRELPQPVEAVLVTGDLADQGAPAGYAEVVKLPAGLPYPVFHCPGNHDERAAYRETLLGVEGLPAPVNQVGHAAGAGRTQHRNGEHDARSGKHGAGIRARRVPRPAACPREFRAESLVEPRRG